jgi:hypothetical protein
MCTGTWIRNVKSYNHKHNQNNNAVWGSPPNEINVNTYVIPSVPFILIVGYISLIWSSYWQVLKPCYSNISPDFVLYLRNQSWHGLHAFNIWHCIQCSEHRLIGLWFYCWQLPAKSVSHLPRKMPAGIQNH